MINITICGVCGRMGKRIATLATYDSELSIVGATEIKGCSLIGINLGDELKTDNLGVAISDVLEDGIQKSDCVIDFTAPKATLANVKTALKHKKPIVIGTTGIDDKGIAQIKEASGQIPVLYSPNMSPGVNVVFSLVEMASSLLGKDYKVSMEERHHVHKKDKPSGTGKLLANIVKRARKDIEDVAIDSFREGEVIGDHKVIFDSDTDIIEISHRAKTRDIFAKGAILAAKFLVNKPAGFYSMNDVLGVR